MNNRLVVAKDEGVEKLLHDAGIEGVYAPNGGSVSQYLADIEAPLQTSSHVVLTMANDEAGDALADELARRIGVGKCRRVQWPDEPPVASEGIVALIDDAKPYPVEGVFSADDLHDEVYALWLYGESRGAPTGWDCITKLYTIKPGEWSLVTGIPGHGKSEFVDALAVNLAMSEGWKTAFYSPENQPLQTHISKLLQKYTDRPMETKNLQQKMSEEQLNKGMSFVNKHFRFILPSDNHEHTLDSILDLARQCVFRDGINCLVLDPWNELEHSRPEKVSETEYISQCLSKIRRFARVNGVHIWVVAHPTKLSKNRDGIYPCPTPYDVSGSAHWRNKADNCLAVYRPDFTSARVDIVVQKIRFKHTGRVGEDFLSYNMFSGRYNEH